MKKSQIIVALTLLLCCGSVFCGPTQYTLQVEWPVRSNYFGDKYTKQDFPLYKGDSFVIKDFFAGYCLPSCQYESQQQNTFSPSKIYEPDCEYLKQYFYRFGQNNHNTTKELWNSSGSCYKKGQLQYFADMVKLNKKYNIFKTLQAKGIVPSKTKIYDSEQFIAALSPLFNGKRLNFYCAMPNETDEKGNYKAPALRYINIFLDDKFNPSDDMSNLCTYDFCTQFRYLPIEF